MAELNYHHLAYFWAVAKDGQLTRTARRLRVAPSALSTQISQLEDSLGEALFEREGRGLRLTEAGHLALHFADDIFEAGTELLATFTEGRNPSQPLRIGAVSTLSRNFQELFLQPLLREAAQVPLRIVSGALEDMLARLESHALDFVLANRPAPAEVQGLRSHHLARQKVSLIGQPEAPDLSFPCDLEGQAMVLPGPASAVRQAFEARCAKAGVSVRLLAEADDMAMLRLLARDSNAIALLPPVVVRDELRSGRLRECCAIRELDEDFYAITADRRFPHPRLRELLARPFNTLLEL